jgi:hypothetical protein
VSAGPGEVEICLRGSRREEEESYSLTITTANIKLTATGLRAVWGSFLIIRLLVTAVKLNFF